MTICAALGIGNAGKTRCVAGGPNPKKEIHKRWNGSWTPWPVWSRLLQGWFLGQSMSCVVVVAKPARTLATLTVATHTSARTVA
jgi:hypothetical protein